MAIAPAGLALLMLLMSAKLAMATAEEDSLEFSQDFLFSKIKKVMLNLPVAVKAASNGTLKRQPASPSKQMSVSCLHSVAPPPLNWQMWCPNTHGNITQWVDDVGTTHRKIVLAPIANMTAQQAVWFMTPAFPETMNVNGQVFTKNKLWHPLDHGETMQFKLQPGKRLLAPPVLSVRLNETYRAASGEKAARVYYTDLWADVTDLALNLPRNRYVCGMEYLGFQPFTLMVKFTDTPRGMVSTIEVLLGIAAVGYDKKNPLKGAPTPVAALANTLLFESVMAPYRKSGQFNAGLDAVTRHVVEEFGNLQWFVPLTWQNSVLSKVLSDLEEVKASLVAATSQPEGLKGLIASAAA